MTKGKKVGAAVANPHLNPELSGKYRIVGTTLPRVLNTCVGDIDFRKLTEEQAEKLIANGSRYLVRA